MEAYLLTFTIPNPLRRLAAAAVLAAPLAAGAQSASTPIGHTSAREVQVSGAVDLRNGEMQLGNGSTVTAGSQPIAITLNRGGDLRLCSTTSVHLSHDRSVDAPDSSALMLALDRGAIEAHYTVGKYSDVLMTPDLRILVSGPGAADFHIRVGNNGDTCVDNRGPNAPYITVSSQLEGGLYRVQPNQHVLFEHGNLREVVDTESSPCGCPAAPAPLSVADAGTTSANSAKPGRPVGGPSSTETDTAFPLAVSEGLAPAPVQPTAPVAAPGEVHAQVLVPFSYNGAAPAPAAPSDTPSTSSTPAPTAPPAAPGPVPPPHPPAARSSPAASAPAVTRQPPATGIAQPAGAAASSPATPAAPAPQHTAVGRALRSVGRFFSKFFGAE